MTAEIVPFPRRRRRRLKFDALPAQVTDLTRCRPMLRCLRGIRIARGLFSDGLISGAELIEWMMSLKADVEAAERAFEVREA